MGMYWNTLRFNRKNYNEHNTKKNHWWQKGTDLAAVLTGRCNLHCDYCPMFFYSDSYPYPSKEYECGLEEWKQYFEFFPDWLSQIYLTGGEPTLMPWLPDLVNWLVDRGHHVILFSNLLKPEVLYPIKKNFRFILYPTFHKGQDKPERYAEAMRKLKENTDFRIYSQEMSGEHTFKWSKHKQLFTAEWYEQFNKLYHVPPDGPRTHKLYLGCVRLYEDGKK